MAIFIPLPVTEKKALCVKIVTEYCQNRLGGLHVEMNINEEYSPGQKMMAAKNIVYIRMSFQRRFTDPVLSLSDRAGGIKTR